MKIYHTETQEDYDALMIELEEKGCEWSFGRKLTGVDNWRIKEHLTCLRVYDSKVYQASLNYYKEKYPDTPITKYKAKVNEKMKFTKENVEELINEYFWQADFESCGDLIAAIDALDDTPEKVVVPKFVAEWIESKKNLNIWKMIDDLRNGNFLENPVINWLIEEYSKYGLSDQFDLLSLIKIYGYTIEPEQLYYIQLPYLETSDGIQQVLSQRKGDKNYFACRPNEKLQQRYTKEELAQVPEIYKPYAKPVEEEAE